MAAVSLMDKSFVNQSLRANDAGMNYLRSSFDNLDVSYLTSYTNFLTIKLGQKTKKIFNELLSQGVILRPLDNYNLSQYLRVTIGSKSENKFLIIGIGINLVTNPDLKKPYTDYGS